MYRPTASHKPRPIFRSSSTYYYLPSTDLVLHTAARSHENYRQTYLYREGRSTVIRWAEIPDIFSKPKTPVTIMDATPTQEGNLAPAQNYAASFMSTGITSTSNSSNQPSSSSSSNSCDDKEWHMVCFSLAFTSFSSIFYSFAFKKIIQKTVDLRYDSLDEEEPYTDNEEEYDEEPAFSSFMLHFPDEDEYDETEYEYDTVVYYDDDLSMQATHGVGSVSRSRTPRRAFAAGIPSYLGGYHHQSKVSEIFSWIGVH